MSRHRWGQSVIVEVPWSETGGHLYTCLKCGTTRHSEPGGALGYFVHVFTAPDGTVTTGKTPPCPGGIAYALKGGAKGGEA